MQSLKGKLDNLKDILLSMEKVTVAFSGGMDSTFLAEIVYQIMPKNLLLVNIDFSFTRKDDTDFTRKFAEKRGIPYLTIWLDPFLDNDITSNPPERCYFCKKNILTLVKKEAIKRGFPQIIDGTNSSDLGDFRPGKKAAQEFLLRHPLLEANLLKPEIKTLSLEMGLENANKPSFSCYATRFPYGESISPEKIERVKKAEDILINLGLKELRVRSHNNLARIEVTANNFSLIIDNKDNILKDFKEIGFAYVTLDIQGFRSGSMNEVL